MKRDNSARSLEVVTTRFTNDGPFVKAATSSQEKWLVEAINERFTRYEAQPTPQLLDELYVLVGSLKILGLDGAHEALKTRLLALK